MKISKIIDYIEKAAPKELALSWDNIGLMVGSKESDINTALFCMDYTSEILNACIDKNIKLVITHHPFIFTPVARIDEETPEGKLISETIRKGITVCSFHTNLDFANGGINDTLIETIGISEYSKDASGTHTFGPLFEETKFSDFVEFVRFALNSPNLRIVCPNEKGKDYEIKNIGVSCGAFDGEYDWLLENNIDVLVTGELKHHNAIALKERGIFVISAGHFETEEPGMERLAENIRAELGIETIVIIDCNPFTDL